MQVWRPLSRQPKMDQKSFFRKKVCESEVMYIFRRLLQRRRPGITKRRPAFKTLKSYLLNRCLKAGAGKMILKLLKQW